MANPAVVHLACGNRMRLLATIEDPQIVEQILTHLGLPISLLLVGAGVVLLGCRATLRQERKGP